MMQDRSEAELEERLADLRWLGALALRLVSDPALADDACQEAWLSVSRRGRSDRRSLFAAFRGALWRRRRGEARRERREQAAARGESVPSTEELIVRGETQRRLWEHLRELAEPFRSTLLLRFQESLSTEEIAARTGVPRDTVRARVRRGLVLLREAVERDEDLGGLRALIVAVPPALFPEPVPIPPHVPTAGSATALSLGGVLMLKTGIAASLAVVLGAVGWTLLGGDEKRALTRPGDARSTEEVALVAGREPGAPLAVASRTEAPSSPERASAVATARPEPGETPRLIGRVVDPDGAPLAGVRWRLNGFVEDPAEGLADQNGHFEVEVPAERGDKVYFELLPGPYHEIRGISFGRSQRPDRELSATGSTDLGDVVLRPAGRITGRLVDELGNPVAGATTDADEGWFSGESGHDGGFVLENVLPGSQDFDVNARGFLDHRGSVTVEAFETTELGDVTLIPGPRVRGIVTDEDGTPLPDARVSARGFTRGWVFDVGEDGRFDIPMPTTEARGIAARAPGFIQSDGVRAEPGASVTIRLASAGEPCTFVVVEEETNEPILRFAVGIGRNAGRGTPAAEREYASGRDPRSSSRETNRIRVTARPLRDQVVVSATGYVTRAVDIEEIARTAEGQRVAMTPSPGLRGRLVLDGSPVAGQEVRLSIGKVSLVMDVTDERERSTLDDDHPLLAVLKAQTFYPMFTVLPTNAEVPQACLGNIGSKPLLKVAQTDADGRFLFRGLKTGAAELYAHDASRGLHARSPLIGILPGESVDVGDLELRSGAVVTGRLEVGALAELAGHRVVLQEGTSCTTDERGAFRFDDLGPGDHYARLEIGPGLFRTDETGLRYHFHVRPDEELDLELPVEARTSSLTTIRVLHNGELLRGNWIEVRTEDLGSIGEALNAEGLARATIPSQIPFSVTVELGDGDVQIATGLTVSAPTEELTLSIDTTSLALDLPAELELTERTCALLDWSTPEGEPREPLYLWLDPIVTANADPRTVEFTHVPVGATNLTLRLVAGVPYEERRQPLFERALDVELEAGVAAKATL